MIEILVALLVLSVGLLGLAALQTFGMRYNQQSYQRTQAVFQVYDMVDRIRANRTALAAGCYDGVAAGAKTATGACAGAYVDCAANTCNSSQLANFDVNRWNTANENLLAQGKGSIATAAYPSRRTITLSWIETDLPVQFVIEVDL